MVRTRAKGKRKPATDGKGKALLELQRKGFNRESVAAILGERMVRTMPEVAREFGVQPATVRQGWRPAGMPGGNGHYSLTDIAVWQLERERKNDLPKQQQSQDKAELQSIEMEKAKLDLADRRRSNDAAEGLLAPVDKIQREVRALIAVTRETLLSIHRTVMPLLPADQAEVVAGVIEKKIRHVVTSLAEKSARQILKEGNEDVK